LLERFHAGNYSCRAENAAGTDQYTAHLSVNGMQKKEFFFVGNRFSKAGFRQSKRNKTVCNIKIYFYFY
jgi:hypothetical protein